MIEAIRRVLGMSFMPHGMSHLWQPWLVWLHVVSDTVISLAYVIIPFTLIYFVRRRRDLPFQWIFLWFGTFIVTCGATHALEVWNVWHANYLIAGGIKAVTALASASTAFLLVRLVPRGLALPSLEHLKKVNGELHQVIAMRIRIEHELHKHAAELELSNKKLAEAERIKTDFLANVSHELRTPLTLILSPLECLLSAEGAGLAGHQKDLLKVIHRNSITLFRMINGQLDFSKLESGRQQVRREPTDIVSLTRSVFSDYLPLMRQRQLDGAFECEECRVNVQMDRYMYERIISNLLSNAVKFTNPGGKVSIQLKQGDDRLRVSVRDTGTGIPELQIGTIFERFRQVEGATAHRFGGIGLGLALVKEFASVLDGTVALETQIGAGSTFTVDLSAPQTRIADDSSAFTLGTYPSEIVPGTSSSTTDFPPSDEGKPTTLLAEDNAELAIHISRLLSVISNVKIVEDGEQALKYLQNNRAPELIVADIMMPRLNGLELCRAIKNKRDTAEIPVMFLTALTHRDALLEGWEAGADEYLFKPFHPVELITRVRSLLKAAQDRKSSRAEIERLSHRLLRLRDEERRSIAREVHDGVGQHVAGLSMALARLRVCGDQNDPELRQILDECRSLVTDAAQEIRTISYLLHPPVIEELGFVSALHWLVRGYVKRSGIEVSLEAPTEFTRLRPEIEMALFRVTQEALTNIHRHSGSRVAVVRLSHYSERVELEIEDKGKGISPDALESIGHDGVGIAGMRERVKELNGRFKIDSSPNVGVTIRAMLPVA